MYEMRPRDNSTPWKCDLTGRPASEETALRSSSLSYCHELPSWALPLGPLHAVSAMGTRVLCWVVIWLLGAGECWANRSLSLGFVCVLELSLRPWTFRLPSDFLEGIDT